MLLPGWSFDIQGSVFPLLNNCTLYNAGLRRADQVDMTNCKESTSDLVWEDLPDAEIFGCSLINANDTVQF